MLTAYENAVIALIQAPSSPVPLIPTATLDAYINTARNQVAQDAECIRAFGSLSLTNGTQGYPFSSIAPQSVTGAGSVIVVRGGTVGSAPVDFFPFEWFQKYYLNSSSTVPTGRYAVAQQGQGVNGTILFAPTPTAGLTASLDVACLPITLVNDSTAEAIPELWTDAVEFYAAWLALMQLQRQADADMMMARYQMLIQRATQGATPSESPDNLPGGPGTKGAGAHTSKSPPGGR